MSEQLDLLTGHPVARSTDPGTSWAAARSISEDQLRASQQAVLSFLRLHGPMDDEKLVNGYQSRGTSPWQSQSGLRTRRHELQTAGYVRDTGERTRLRSGRLAIIWEAT